MLPVHIRQALAGRDDLDHLPGIPSWGAGCEGARHHSPTPLLVSAVPLVSPHWSGDGAKTGPTAILCGTCAGNLSVLQHLLHLHDGRPPWALRREFGNLIRAHAERGWQHHQEVVRATQHRSSR